MSDSYQAIYDAVRSRLSNGDIGSAVTEAMRGSFDISYAVEGIKQEFMQAAYQMQRPVVIMKPALSIDGNQYCFLYGTNLHDGVAGFGDTPEKAALAFDLEWLNSTTKATK